MMNSQGLAIITGVSRGLGAGLARKLLEQGFTVFGISRHTLSELEDWNTSGNRRYYFYSLDLSDPAIIEPAMLDIYEEIRGAGWQQAVLINNAGVLEPIKALADCGTQGLVHNLHVNLLAPLIISSGFIRNTRGLCRDRRIINISSGAGRKPYHGWSAYCAAKAGMDRFTQVIELERKELDPDLRVVSLAPGIIDTRMQETIRNTDEKDFPLLEKFIDYHENGDLAHPDELAECIYSHFIQSDFESGGLFDIRDYL